MISPSRCDTHGGFKPIRTLSHCFVYLSLSATLSFSQTETVTFDSDPFGAPVAPFTSVDSANVSFSAPSDLSMDLVIIHASSTFPTQALSVNQGANSSIELNFSNPVSSLSLDFQGDIANAAPANLNLFDEARLTGFNGTTLVTSTSATPDFINYYPGSGAATTAPPQNLAIANASGITRAIFSFYLMGTPAVFGTETIDNIVFTLIPLAPAAPAGGGRGNAAPAPLVASGGGGSGGGGHPKKPASFLLVDNGAILSAETTGLLIPIVNRSVVQSASSGAIRDLNSRLFRARSGGEVGPASQFAGASGGTMVRYLDFASKQGLDYEETITLGDGVAVSVHNTLLTGGAIMAVGPDGKAVVSDPGIDPKGVVPPLAPAYAYNRFQVFSEFDYGFYDQDNLTELVRGFESDTYSGSVGAEFRVAPWLHIGGAFSYLESDTDIGSNYGNIDLDGTLISAYATTFYGNFYLDTLYSFGQFDNDIHRNTLLGRHATGNTESETHNVDVNLGYNIPLTRKITIGPTLGVNYATGDIDGYTETGGRNANLIFQDDDFESTIGRLGGQISYSTDTGCGKVTLQGRVGWAHEFTPENDPISAELETSPYLLVNNSNATRIGSYRAQSGSAYAGEDWLELGAGVRLDLSRSWSVQVDYEGQFARDDAEAHFVGLKLSYEWGTQFLSALR